MDGYLLHNLLWYDCRYVMPKSKLTLNRINMQSKLDPYVFYYVQDALDNDLSLYQ